MAAEMEEPINFQASSLHSGSISFGRFESESLLWERRSSFSHNRYLEEVEKYKTPGSVVQKKAYFEAHFKKKTLQRQASESQKEVEEQTSENDTQEHTSCLEESPRDNKGNHFHYDESTDGSDNHEGCGVDSERNDDEITISVHQTEPSVISSVADSNSIDDLQHIEPAGVHQTELESDAIQSKTEVEQRLELRDDVENIDGLTKGDQSPQSQTSGRKQLLSKKKLQKPTVKIMAETRTAKPKFLSQVPRKITSGTSKNVAKQRTSVERETVPISRTGKQSSQKALQGLSSRPRTLKTEDPKNCRSKSVQENRSEKDKRAKSVGTMSQPLTSDMAESRLHQTSVRSKRTAVSSKLDSRPSPAIFSFKSDERAEKRKEFYMKLEEKMHAKETEMNQIQAKTREETNAKMRQFRRSLNFKAKPMPSFYHEAVSSGSDSKKATSTHRKSTILQSKSVSPAGGASSRSPALSKSVHLQDHPVRESSSSSSNFPTLRPETGDSSTLPASSDTNQAGNRLNASAKKDKVNNAAIRQKQQSVGSTTTRKMTMKGISIGSISVDVTS